MKGQINNFVTPVRAAITEAGYSYVKVLSAVNSYLGQLEAIESSTKLGNASWTKKGFKISDIETTKYEDSRNIVGLFVNWHQAIEKADKLANMDSVSLPTVFTVWLQKMKEVKPTEQESSTPANQPA